MNQVRILASDSKKEISKPAVKNLTLELDAKVAKLEKSKNSFDYWCILSTLEKGKPIYIPIKLHRNAKKLIKNTKLKKMVRLKNKNGIWYASFIVEKKVEAEKKDNKEKVGVDVGVKALLVDSNENFYGEECYEKLKCNIDKMTQYHKNRQKLTSCLKKKYGEEIELPDNRYLKKQKSLSSWRKNEIGKAINNFVNKNKNKTIVLENLCLNLKKKISKKVNCILNRSLMGYLKDKLLFKLQDLGIMNIAVQAAYSSQECLSCGWVSRENRKTQEKFKCEICDYESNADVNASLIIKGRSHDKKLNSIHNYRQVKGLLKKRFYDIHSISSWLDLDSFITMSGKEFRKVLNRQSAKLKLKIVQFYAVFDNYGKHR